MGLIFRIKSIWWLFTSTRYVLIHHIDEDNRGVISYIDNGSTVETADVIGYHARELRKSAVNEGDIN